MLSLPLAGSHRAEKYGLGGHRLVPLSYWWLKNAGQYSSAVAKRTAAGMVAAGASQGPPTAGVGAPVCTTATRDPERPALALLQLMPCRAISLRFSGD